MNDEAVKLLRELADKMGTTVEHLWGVLVRQAPIEGWASIAQCAGVGVAWWFWWRLRKSIGTGYEEEGKWIAIIVSGIVLGFVSFVMFFSIGDLVACFVNPEYWALGKLAKMF